MYNSISRLVSTSKTLTFSAALVAAVAPAFVLGCGSSNGESPSGTGTVGASATAYNRSTHALSAAAGVNFINGTYTGCAGHPNSAVWSVPLAGAMGSPTNPVTLSVALNDVNCALAITSIDADQNYTTATPLSITSTFVAPSPFVFSTTVAAGAAGTVAFYANTQMNPADFSHTFDITLNYSDDPSRTVGTAQAVFAQVFSTAESNAIVAPNYGADLSLVSISTDANNVVVGESGVVTFPNGTGNHLGETYVIHQGALADNTFATADTAFNADTATIANVGTPTSIPTGTFVQDTNNLTVNKTVTVIFRNQDAGGVSAYEAIELTFTKPTP
jgi:hypothetical protein